MSRVIAKDHPAYHTPNFGRLFREAVHESIADAADRSLIEPGYYVIRLGRDRPLVAAAKIWWCDHEPDNPENKLDQPFLAGEILGDAVDPVYVWHGRDREPLVPKDGLSLEEEYAYQVALKQHMAEHEPNEPLARPRRPVDLTKIDPILPPGGGAEQ